MISKIFGNIFLDSTQMWTHPISGTCDQDHVVQRLLFSRIFSLFVIFCGSPITWLNSPIIEWIRKIYNIKFKLQIFAQLLQDTQSKSVPGFWKAIWEIFFGVLQNPWKFAWVKNWTNRKICKNVFWVLTILFKILLVLKVKTP